MVDTNRFGTRMVTETASHSLSTPLSPMSASDVFDRFRNVANLDAQTARGYTGRIILAPGQQIAYGAGILAILGLREKVRETLGELNIKEFHDVILKDGTGGTINALTLAIDAYIASKLAE